MNLVAEFQTFVLWRTFILYSKRTARTSHLIWNSHNHFSSGVTQSHEPAELIFCVSDVTNLMIVWSEYALYTAPCQSHINCECQLLMNCRYYKFSYRFVCVYLVFIHMHKHIHIERHGIELKWNWNEAKKYCHSLMLARER